MVDWEEFYARFREPNFLPGYEIAQRLGSGAFGEVYEATKLSIGKRYAVKFLKVAGEGDSTVIEREISQARLFASIDHPNLVAVEDVGLASGVPYLIMGHAGEDTLARRLEGDPLPKDQAFDIFVQVCRGVLALHDRNLAHFDIKPSNVFLSGENARIGDYGLSKLLQDDRNTLSFGRGTPRYMAPEILVGRGDRRADVFSLGILLFESLTGELPFETDGSHLVPGGDRPIEPDFPPDFPVEFRQVVERCLRRDPAERYPSVAELLADLGAPARRGDSVVLPPVNGAPAPPRRAVSLAATEAASGGGGEVLEWETLDGDGAAPAPPPAPESVATGPIPSLRRDPSSEFPFAEPGPEGPPRIPAKIPVPPRVTGGPWSTGTALWRTGFEVFVGLVVLPVLTAVHLLAPWTRRLFRAVRRLGSFVWFATLCFGAGAFVVWLLFEELG